MATRMQQRRGTAAQWISTNSGAGPVLNAGEMGWESDTNKFKIGDGVNNWTSLDYFSDINSTVNPAFGSSISFEGATANDFETTLAIIDPTADRTITFPDATGTVALTSDIIVTASSTNTLSNKSISLASNTVTSTLAQLNTAISDADVATLAGTETLTNKTLTSPTLTTPNIGVASGTSLTLTGNLTVQGTTTTIDSTTIAIQNAFVFEGATANDFETTLTVTDPTADRTLTLPDATDTLVGKATTDTLTNKSISLGSNTVTSTLAQLNTAISDADVATLAGTETLTNKTLTSPTLTTPALGVATATSINGTTIPSSKTLVATDSTQYVVPSQTGNSGKYLTTDGTTSSWGTVSSYSAPTLGSTSIASGATVTTIAGLTLTSPVATTAFTLNGTAELRLADTDSSHYVGFKAPGTVSTNRIWTLPSTDGTAGQALSTNGSGTLSWATAGGGAAFSEFMLIGA